MEKEKKDGRRTEHEVREDGSHDSRTEMKVIRNAHEGGKVGGKVNQKIKDGKKMEGSKKQEGT